MNESLILRNVTQNKSEIAISVFVSVKTQENIKCVKKVIFGILLQLVMKMVMITCDEIIDMAKSTSIKTVTAKSLYADIKKEFYSKPVYNYKFLKTKMISYGDEAIDFDDEEMPKVGYNHTCLAEPGFYS